MLNPTLPLLRYVCALCSVQAAAKPTAYFSSKHCLQQQKRSSKPKKAATKPSIKGRALGLYPIWRHL